MINDALAVWIATHPVTLAKGHPYSLEIKDDMGQAFDREGNILAEAFGETKQEVFDKLQKMQKDAAEIRIRELHSKESVNADLERNFTYHAPKPGQPEIYAQLRDKAKEFAYLINELCPQSRERSVAMTHLETAVFWANTAIARN